PRREPPANARVARNLTIARKFYEGHHRPAEPGPLDDAWSRDNFADGWTLFSPWTGELRPPSRADCAALVKAAFRRLRNRLPDLKADHFEAWPTDDGCAWRWRLGGHSAEGTRYEFWETVFILTDDAGMIARLEFYGDWQGFPQTMGFAT